MHQIALTVRIAATHRPRFVEEMMLSVLQASTRIVKNSPPIVAMTTIDAIAIEVELLFRVGSPADRAPARNEILDFLHNQCKANGLSLAVSA